MLENVSSPENALIQSESELVFKFQYDPEEQLIELICDYWDLRPDANRAFIEFKFTGVSRFNSKGDMSIKYPHLDVHNELESASRKVEYGILFINLNFRNGKSVSFQAEGMFARARHARVVRRDAEFDYFDLESGKKFEFEHPFTS